MEANTGQAMKQKREQFSIDIRRSVNDTIFASRRRQFLGGSDGPASKISSEPAPLSEETLRFCARAKPGLESALASNNTAELMNLVAKLREMLSQSSDPSSLPVEEFFVTGIVPSLLDTLRLAASGNDSGLLMETLWLISNLSVADLPRLEFMVSKGLFQLYLKILDFESRECFEHVTWSLANMMGESIGFREQIEKAGLWPAIFANFDLFRHVGSVQKSCSWLFANSMRSPPHIRPDLVC